MLKTTQEFDRLIGQNTKVSIKASIAFADGTTIDIEGDDFMQGGLSVDEAVASSSSFDIGAAVIGELTVTLNNYDERFSEYDFAGAKVTPFVGVARSDGITEWIQKGEYWIDQPSSYPSTLTLTALDNMTLLERDYSEVVTVYPSTLGTIARDICAKCGVTLKNAAFPNFDFVVKEKPADKTTCLDMISHVAQAAGCWAKMDNTGKLDISWYDTTAFDNEDWLDGGDYEGNATPYATGDIADGGSFASYSSGDSTAGGSFESRGYALVYAISSSQIIADDVLITGVRVTVTGEVEGSNTSVLHGEEGYVLEIKDNPLISHEKATEAAGRIGRNVAGLRFRPFALSALGNPVYEAGDPILIVDAKQRVYRSYITRLTYKVGSYSTIACNAETPSRNKAKSYSPIQTALDKLKGDIAKEKTDRELALENLATKIGANSGMFMTTEEAENGGKVYYMHDQSTLAQSHYVWKMTADAIAISTDGGKTYSYGLDVDGNAILERVYTIGLDASYINTGSFTIRKGEKIMFNADVDTGDVYINGESLSIDTSSISAAIDQSKVHYAYCDTTASVVQKEVYVEDFDPEVGSLMCVKFTYENSAQSPTIKQHKSNGSTLDAFPVYMNGDPIGSEFFWGKGSIVLFCFREFQRRFTNNAGVSVVTKVRAWEIVDNGASAQFRVLSDRILATVSDTYIDKETGESYATKSEIKQTADQITLSVQEVSARFGTCTTASATTGKAVVCNGFKLKEGAVVSVRFTYENTAGPITLNVNNTGAKSVKASNKLISTANPYNWRAGDTVSFIYDGTYWNVTSNGITSLSSRISIEKDDITIEADRFSWASTYSNLTKNGELTCTKGNIGGFAIDASSISNDRMTLDSSGLRLKLDRSTLGGIGTAYYVDDVSKKGLAFNLDANGAYMTWAAKSSSTEEFYTYKLVYANKYIYNSSNELMYRSGRLYVDCPFDLHNNIAYEMWIDPNTGGANGGVTGTLNCQWPRSIGSDGIVNTWASSGHLTFKNGLLVGATL